MNAQCNQCGALFFSRKQRHNHQMLWHRSDERRGKQLIADHERNRAAKKARDEQFRKQLLTA